MVEICDRCPPGVYMVLQVAKHGVNLDSRGSQQNEGTSWFLQMVTRESTVPVLSGSNLYQTHLKPSNHKGEAYRQGGYVFSRTSYGGLHFGPSISKRSDSQASTYMCNYHMSIYTSVQASYCLVAHNAYMVHTAFLEKVPRMYWTCSSPPSSTSNPYLHACSTLSVYMGIARLRGACPHGNRPAQQHNIRGADGQNQTFGTMSADKSTRCVMRDGHERPAATSPTIHC